jgi:hypothetical protein
MIKKILGIFTIFAIMLIFFGCSSNEETTKTAAPDKAVCAQDVKECADGSYVSRDPANGCEFKSCTSSTTTPETPETGVDVPAEIQAIIDKIPNLKSYEYLDTSTGKIILKKGDKSVIITSNINEYVSGSYRFNTIFLDSSNRKAYAACIDQPDTRQSFPCGSNRGKYTEMNYDSFKIDNPIDKLTSLTSGKITGTVSCESRTCDIIEYTKDGTDYKMYVRQVYVLPFKIVKVDSEGEETEVVAYKDGAFNHLKDSDMAVPADFEKV